MFSRPNLNSILYTSASGVYCRCLTKPPKHAFNADSVTLRVTPSVSSKDVPQGFIHSAVSVSLLPDPQLPNGLDFFGHENKCQTGSKLRELKPKPVGGGGEGGGGGLRGVAPAECLSAVSRFPGDPYLCPRA